MSARYRKVKQHREGFAVMCTVCGVVVLNEQVHENHHAMLDRLMAKEAPLAHRR